MLDFNVVQNLFSFLSIISFIIFNFIGRKHDVLVWSISIWVMVNLIVLAMYYNQLWHAAPFTLLVAIILGMTFYLIERSVKK